MSAANKTTKKAATKSGRGPGRPRKNKETHKLPKLGIVKEPTNVEIFDPHDLEKDLTKRKKIPNPDPRTIYVMEMIYDNPGMWKRIFMLLANLSVDTTRIKFEEEGITIIAQDHNEKCEIFVEVFGKELSRYYCEEPFEVSVNQESMKKIVGTIKATHVSIAFAADADIKCKKFRTILHYKTAKTVTWKTFNLDCEQAPEYEGTIIEDLKLEDEYPVQFTLESKYWKTCVTDWLKFSDSIKLEIEPPFPLTVKQTFTTKKGTEDMVFEETDHMNLKCEIEEGDVFAVSVLLHNIKAIANSAVADDITISADEENKLIFTALLDQDTEEVEIKDPKDPKKKKLVRRIKAGSETCRIKILTKVVDLREKNNEEDE